MLKYGTNNDGKPKSVLKYETNHDGKPGSVHLLQLGLKIIINTIATLS